MYTTCVPCGVRRTFLIKTTILHISGFDLITHLLSRTYLLNENLPLSGFDITTHVLSNKMTRLDYAATTRGTTSPITVLITRSLSVEGSF
jgi:hypothetical protein